MVVGALLRGRAPAGLLERSRSPSLDGETGRLGWRPSARPSRVPRWSSALAPRCGLEGDIALLTGGGRGSRARSRRGRAAAVKSMTSGPAWGVCRVSCGVLRAIARRAEGDPRACRSRFERPAPAGFASAPIELATAYAPSAPAFPRSAHDPLRAEVHGPVLHRPRPSVEGRAQRPPQTLSSEAAPCLAGACYDTPLLTSSRRVSSPCSLALPLLFSRPRSVVRTSSPPGIRDPSCDLAGHGIVGAREGPQGPQPRAAPRGPGGRLAPRCGHELRLVSPGLEAKGGAGGDKRREAPRSALIPPAEGPGRRR